MTTRPPWWQRLAGWLGLTLALAPVDPEPDPPLTPVEVPIWCSHTWPAAHDEDHICELAAGHGTLTPHTCDCGAQDIEITDQAASRLLRLVRLPAHYDDCLWPEDDVCPRHDRGEPWPAGRDCLGVCTNCNAPQNAWCVPSCLHYDPEAEARHAQHMRAIRGETQP